MNMPKIFLSAILVFVSITVASSQSATGTINYLEGEVSIFRGELRLGPDQISVGTAINEFDTIETGAGGYVEITMAAPSAGSLIKVKNGTSFYFEGTPPKSNWFRTTFQLLRGSISLKVGKLGGRESYQVQTDNAVMAVLGTEFTVDMSSDRSVLVTVPEGSVESTSGRRTVIAEPGAIAVIDSGSSVRKAYINIEDLNLYREYWKGLRQQALRVNAKLSIQQYSRLWDRDLVRLEAAMSELMKHEEIFQKWAEIAEEGKQVPGTGETIRDKSAISRGMLELRAALPTAERSFNTLIDLEKAWIAGYAEGNFSAGAYNNAGAFYR